MLSERTRTAIEVLRLAKPEIKSGMYAAAAQKQDGQDYLRALVIVALEGTSAESTMKQLWEALSRAALSGSTNEVELMAEVLRDEEVFDPKYRADVDRCVRQHILPMALRDPELQAVADRIWGEAVTTEMAETLWRRAFTSYDMEATERLAQRVGVEGLEFMHIMSGHDQRPVVRFFVANLSDQALDRALEEVHGYLRADPSRRPGGLASNSDCLSNLYELTAEHVRRHGAATQMPARFFDALDQWHDAWMRGLEDVASEVAEMACDLDRLSSPAVTQLVYRYVNSISVPELARFVERGLPLVRSDADAARLGRASSGMKYLLPLARGEHRLVVAKAMTPEARREFMVNAEGFAQHFPNFTREWGGDVSVVDESVLTALHAAGYDLAQQVPLYAGSDEMRHLHDIGYTGSEGRFIFVSLHALGVYPKDLRFDGFGPLHYAASYNDVKAIERLVALGHSVDDPADRWVSTMFAGRGRQDGWTPLMLAVKYGRADAVRALLALGADAAFTSGGGHSPAKLASAPLDKKATTFDKQRAEDIKRLLKAARLGQKISGAMPEADEQPEAAAIPRDAGVL